MNKPKRPRDTNLLAKAIADLATGEKTEPVIPDTRNPNAVALGRLGGLVGGKARAKALSKIQRTKIAKLGAHTRWGKRPRAA
jgi:hypothetical protein